MSESLIILWRGRPRNILKLIPSGYASTSFARSEHMYQNATRRRRNVRWVAAGIQTRGRGIIDKRLPGVMLIQSQHLSSMTLEGSRRRAVELEECMWKSVRSQCLKPEKGRRLASPTTTVLSDPLFELLWRREDGGTSPRQQTPVCPP